MWKLLDHYDYMTQHGVLLPPFDSPAPEREPCRVGDWSDRVQEYLERQPPAYRSLVEDLAGGLPSMSPGCRIVVLIPARNEAHNLQRLLDLFDSQRDQTGRLLDGSSFEVLLLLNRFSHEPDDGSRHIVRDWVRAAERRWAPSVLEYVHPANESAPLTMARKLLADLVVYRSARRPSSRPVYLAFEDADLLWNDPCQLHLMVRTLDVRQDLDAVRGQQDRCPWMMRRFPLLFLMRRSWNFSESYASRSSLWPLSNAAYDFNWNRITTSGWNTAIRSSVYVAIGGYTRERPLEEDMDLGEKISVWRGEFDGHRFVPRVECIGRIPTRSESSPRRWLYWLTAGVHPYLPDNNYANFFDAQHMCAVKKLSLAHLEARTTDLELDATAISQAESLLSGDYCFLIKCTRDLLEAKRAYRTILTWLGFPLSAFEVRADSVVVKSLDGPAAKIRAYSERWPESNVLSHCPLNLPSLHGRRTWRLSSW